MELISIFHVVAARSISRLRHVFAALLTFSGLHFCWRNLFPKHFCALVMNLMLTENLQFGLGGSKPKQPTSPRVNHSNPPATQRLQEPKLTAATLNLSQNGRVLISHQESTQIS